MNKDPRFYGWQLVKSDSECVSLITMKDRFASLAERIERDLEADRYRALALTSLEEACMWATRAFYSQNGEPEVWESEE